MSATQPSAVKSSAVGSSTVGSSAVASSTVGSFNARNAVLSSAVSPVFEKLETRQHLSVTPTSVPGGPYTVAEGQSVLISGLGSIDSDGSVATYQWDTNYSAGRGFRNRLTSPTWSFSPDDSGQRQIALRVIDNSGDASGIESAVIQITDVAPTLTLNLPGNAKEGETTSISWSYTDPGVSDDVSNWNVSWGDGTDTDYAGDLTTAGHVYAQDGSYTVTLTSTQVEATTSVTQTLAVANVPPIVDAATPNATLDEGDTARINFSSPNRAGTIEDWSIDWGDGNIDVFNARRAFANHVYGDNGSYTATVTAFEPDGGEGSSTVNFTVGNVAPEISIVGEPLLGNEGTAITLGSTLSDPGFLDTHTFGWTLFRDGQHIDLPAGTDLGSSTFTFTPPDNGTYMARLTVVDDDGGMTTVNSEDIEIYNVAPAATITGTPAGSITEGDPVSLAVSATDAGIDDTLTYAWSVTKDAASYALPADTVVNGDTFAFTPGDNGTYLATVVVTDNDGATVSVSTSAIAALNAAPTATIDATPATANEGDVIPLGATVTDAGAEDTQSYQWAPEKFLAGGKGTVGFDGSNYGELGSYDWGTDFTLTARMQMSSATPDGSYLILRDYASNIKFSLVKAGADYSIRYTDSAGSAVTSASGVVPTDRSFDLALGYTGNTGAASFYVDGTAVPTSGSVGANMGGVRHTHFGQGFVGTFDQFAVYHDTLSAADVLALHNDADITTAPFDLFEFNEDPGSNSAASSTATGKVIPVSGATFSGADRWVAVAVPAGTNVTGQTFNFVPPDNGTYRVKLTVTDKDGASVATQTDGIVVANVAPTAAIIDVPASTPEATPVTLESAVTDPGTADAPYSYLWSVTKDGQPFALPGGTATGDPSLTFTPDNDGAYVVSLGVTDKDGGTVTTTTALNVVEAPPRIAIGGLPEGGFADEGDTLNLTSDVSDPDGVASYAWTVTRDGLPVVLPAGTIADADTLAFAVPDNGAYAVTLTATDTTGASASQTVNITANNVAPTVAIVGEPGAPVGESTPIALTANATDVAGDALTYRWSVTRDGLAYALPAAAAVDAAAFSFAPGGAGMYVATVVVTDKDGGATTQSSGTVEIIDQPPVVSVASPTTGQEGQTLTATSTVIDGTDDTHTYQWQVQKQVADNGYDLGIGYGLTTLPAPTNGVGAGLWFKPTGNGGSTQLLMRGLDNNTERWRVELINGTDVVMTTSAGTRSVNNTVTAGEWNFVLLALNGPYSGANLYVNTTYSGYAANVISGLGSVLQIGVPTTANAFDGAIDDVVTLDFFSSSATSVDLRSGNLASAYDAWDFKNISQNDAVSSTSNGGLLSLVGGSVTQGRGMVLAPITLAPGTQTTASTFNFTPPDNGTYRMRLAVTDNHGVTVEATGPDIVVDNVPPAVVLTKPGNTTEGVPLTFSAAATDADSDLSYAWTLTKDGQPYTLPSGTATNGTSITFLPGDQGAYEATVTVTDKDGGQTAKSGTVTVTNAPPVVNVTGPATGTESQPLSFSSTATDAADDTLAYGWTVFRNGTAYPLPGGTNITAPNLVFTPDDDGSYVARLTVVDKDGAMTTRNSSPAVVADVPPVVTFFGPQAGTEGQTASYIGSASDVSPADTSAGFAYAWTVTKGNQTVATGNAAAFNYTPAVHGDYTVKLVVTDKDGHTTTQQGQISVANVAPAAVSLTGDRTRFVEGNTIHLTAGATDAPDDALTYAWQAKKGNTVFASGTGSDVSFVAARGDYQIVVTATDTAGASASDTFAMTVGNVAPDGRIVAPDGNVLIGRTASFALTATDVPANQSLAVTFDYGDGSPLVSTTMTNGQTLALSHKYAPVRGLYAVTATLSDGQSTSTVTSQVYVAEAAMLNDEFEPGKRSLYVLGSSAADTIDVSPQSSGKYAVTYNGVSLGRTFDPTARIYVTGGDGANVITVSGDVDAVVLAEGSGSTVSTGAGNDYISGSEGGDRLYGGTGNDVIIGNAGPDTLNGGSGDDALVSGIIYTANDTGKAVAMSRAWNSATTVAARKAALAKLFSGQTISDAGSNQLYGETDNDWFFINSAIDRIRDLQPSDLVN